MIFPARIPPPAINSNLLTRDLSLIYETLAEYPAIDGGDECGAGRGGMESPLLLLFMMSCGLPRGVSLQEVMFHGRLYTSCQLNFVLQQLMV
jgi:hypothetical protein